MYLRDENETAGGGQCTHCQGNTEQHHALKVAVVHERREEDADVRNYTYGRHERDAVTPSW